MTLQELQQAIAKLEKANGWVNSPDEKVTFITEEMGEVAKWVRKARNKELSPDELKDLNYEIADVLQHIISLANHFELDIEEGLVEKKELSKV